MTIKKLARKILVKLIVYIILLGMIAAVLQSVEPLVSAEIALGQMENSNESFVVLNSYNWLKSIRHAVYFVAWLMFTSTIARDVYKFIKNKGETNK